MNKSDRRQRRIRELNDAILSEGLIELIGGYDALRTELDFKDATIEIRDAIFEVAASVGQDPRAIDRFMQGYRAIEMELYKGYDEDERVSTQSIIRAAGRLYEDIYLGPDVTLLGKTK